MAFFRHPHLAQGESGTAEYAAALADRVAATQGAVCLCLYGTLGMGKSVFARAFIRHLGRDPARDVPSPTFTLVQNYEIPEDSREIRHFDLYRLEDADDIFDLDWDAALAGDILIVEWPDRLGAYLPCDRIDVTIEKTAQGEGDARHITITPQGRLKDMT